MNLRQWSDSRQIRIESSSAAPLVQCNHQLREAEERKRHAPFGSPEFVAAAKETEELSRLTFRWAQMQLSMSLAVAGREVDDDTELVEIQPRPLDRVLIQWREAQLRLEIAEPGSPESEAAVRDIERLRDEYRAGHDARRDDARQLAETSSDGPSKRHSGR